MNLRLGVGVRKIGSLFVVGILLGVVSFLMGSPSAQAQTESMIGYELISEDQDAPTKTYSVTFEVWSNDRDAQELSVTPKVESESLEILSKKRQWRGSIKKQKRYKHTVSVKNTGSETGSLILEVRRRSDKRTDSKNITVLVAPF